MSDYKTEMTGVTWTTEKNPEDLIGEEAELIAWGVDAIEIAEKADAEIKGLEEDIESLRSTIEEIKNTADEALH